jgi:hypothetical protein
VWQGKDCESAEQTDPIRQGDVLRKFANGQPDSLWVVVTADCDIAQSKVSESGVACVHLLSLRDYLQGEHLARVVTRQADSRLREFRDWVHAHWQKKPPPRGQLSDSAISEWVSVASAAEIASELGIDDKAATKTVESTLNALRAARDCLTDRANSLSKLRALAQLQRKPPADWRQFVQTQFARLQSTQLPDDLFFVTRIPNEQNLGFVARLRSLSFIRWHSIAATIPEAREQVEGYARIARLTATFKHGLAQQVGTLFARIGYPRAYEVERDEIFDLITDELCNELENHDG